MPESLIKISYERIFIPKKEAPHHYFTCIRTQKSMIIVQSRDLNRQMKIRLVF